MLECISSTPSVCCEVDSVASPNAKKWLQRSERVVSNRRRTGWTHFDARSFMKIISAPTTPVKLRRNVLVAQHTTLWILSLGKDCVCRSYGPSVKAETMTNAVFLRDQGAEEGMRVTEEVSIRAWGSAMVNMPSKPASCRSEDSRYAIRSPEGKPVVMVIVYIGTFSSLHRQLRLAEEA